MDTDLFQVEYDETQKKYIILTNWVKMLYNRGWLNSLKTSVDNIVKSLKFSEDDVVHIKTYARTYAMKLFFRKISTIRKVDEIEDFLDKNNSSYRFFVISQMANKAQKQLLEYNDVEVFTDEELLENIIENIYVPIHIVLSEEEATKYKDEYRLKNTDIQRIFTTDPIAKYYNIKPGQLVKIIRPSLTAGEEIAFRLCVPGQII